MFPYGLVSCLYLSLVMFNVTLYCDSVLLYVSMEFWALHPLRILSPLLLFPLSFTVRNMRIIFDSSLSLSSNVIPIAKSYRLILRFLYPTHQLIDEKSAKLIIHVFILPKLDYCCSLYSHSFKNVSMLYRKSTTNPVASSRTVASQ